MGLYVVVLLLMVACAGNDAAEVTPTATTFTTYTDDDLGLSLEYPDGWITKSDAIGLNLASGTEALEGGTMADIGDEAFVTIIPGELAMFAMQTGQELAPDQPLPMLRIYRGLLENEGQTFSVVTPSATESVGGRHLASTTLDTPVDGETLRIILAIVTDGDYVALVSAGASQDRFAAVQPTLEQIVRSITLRTPAGVTS
jgi:hypothetical protein